MKISILFEATGSGLGIAREARPLPKKELPCYPFGLGAGGGNLAAGFSVFGAPGGGTVPGVGPTGGSPGGRCVGGGALCVPANSARSFNHA
jgi:hypothetical protein